MSISRGLAIKCVRLAPVDENRAINEADSNSIINWQSEVFQRCNEVLEIGFLGILEIFEVSKVSTDYRCCIYFYNRNRSVVF